MSETGSYLEVLEEIQSDIGCIKDRLTKLDDIAASLLRLAERYAPAYRFPEDGEAL